MASDIGDLAEVGFPDVTPDPTNSRGTIPGGVRAWAWPGQAGVVK
ncbi:hypothetical protein GCM10009789_07120 [Kribbella sancticallisti]|uniref:Uncharacterized protein n=1 Tax=Kribbella sancticallisti TaxID=460087 RepID=A0ABP4N6K0_9ACTN